MGANVRQMPPAVNPQLAIKLHFWPPLDTLIECRVAFSNSLRA